MDYLSLEKYYIGSSGVICCELVSKMQQYASIIQSDMNLLNNLQLNCNQLLDTFYALREHFEFLINEMLLIKYFAEDELYTTKEYLKEFSTFTQNVWKMGKFRFSEKGNNAKYISLIGCPLSEVVSTINSFLHEVIQLMTFTPAHSECATALCTLSSQIQIDLQTDSLGSADACVRQLSYLELAIPFLQELCELVQHYLSLPEVHTLKQFVDSVIRQIPSIENLKMQDDMEDTKPYRFVIDLLNGKLLDDDILDHNSDIRPVVEDDVNLKMSLVVRQVVQWIFMKINKSDLPNMSVSQNSNFITGFDVAEGNKDVYKDMKHFLNSLIIRTTQSLSLQKSGEANASLINSSITPSPRRTRGNKMKINKLGTTHGPWSSDDLQPIKLHILQSPLMSPLL